MNHIAKYRKAKGLTQSELANLTGCHWITISKLEREEIGLTVGWMQRLAPLLGVEPSALMFEGGPETGIPVSTRRSTQSDRIEAKLDAIMAHLGIEAK